MQHPTPGAYLEPWSCRHREVTLRILRNALLAGLHVRCRRSHHPTGALPSAVVRSSSASGHRGRSLGIGFVVFVGRRGRFLSVVAIVLVCCRRRDDGRDDGHDVVAGRHRAETLVSCFTSVPLFSSSDVLLKKTGKCFQNQIEPARPKLLLLQSPLKSSEARLPLPPSDHADVTIHPDPPPAPPPSTRSEIEPKTRVHQATPPRRHAGSIP